jgi:pimeloyl-ACP methyl ester carboxylesterase/DNA-binding CsgD family transcriptional regulator
MAKATKRSVSMSDLQSMEALSVIASAIDETHDGLQSFTETLNSIDDVPSFWWGNFPVWVSSNVGVAVGTWPMKYMSQNRVAMTSSDGQNIFSFPLIAFQTFSEDVFAQKLSDAEFVLLSDLATGLSIETSALKANVATSTRRKQLQGCFRKLGVTSQVELVSLANRVIARLTSILAKDLDPDTSEWAFYSPFLPVRVRRGVLEDASQRTVRYLEVGPVTGRPILILHPMMFPHIDELDVDLFFELGLRAIWPIRSGCLNFQKLGALTWAQYCEQTVSDLHLVHTMCAEQSVPIIALVSSGGYATRFAEKHPECVERIDYVSTCFSSGKSKSRDAYFGDYLVRSLRNNGRMAVVAVQHIVGVALSKNQLEGTLRRIFRGSDADQEEIRLDFSDPSRSERAKFTVKSSIDSIRFDYLSQLNFSWLSARHVKVEKQFWHGAQDHVHDLDDLSLLAEQVSGKKAKVITNMGHLTQGSALRKTFRQIAGEYSKWSSSVKF